MTALFWLAGILEDRTLGVLGERRVNVLQLNLALDARLGAPKEAPTQTPAPSQAPAPSEAPKP